MDRWGDAEVTLWWRDDDAGAPTPALGRLLELSDASGVPVGLGVIPAVAGEALAAATRSRTGVRVLQHGFAHVNHAPQGEKNAEFGDHRPLTRMCEDIAAGTERLRTLFGDRLLPCFVPPWNRLAARLAPELPSLGIRTLSTFTPRSSRVAAPGLVQVNTHMDLIDWRGRRGFKGTRVLVDAIAAHLGARRRRQADADEPTGILSHHLQHDQACWVFLEQLFERTQQRGNVRWLSIDEAV